MSDLDLPSTEQLKYSSKPCPRCSWHHELNYFSARRKGADGVGRSDRVRVTGESRYGEQLYPVPVGALGHVVEWSQYSGDLYVRVQLDDLDTRGQRWRENFYPCDLEHEEA